MTIEKFHVYLADLNPRMGTEPGKIRPVAVVQTDLLNTTHPSTLVCPLTTNVVLRANILRVHLPTGTAGLVHPSDIMVDQLRAIDNRRFRRHLGVLTDPQKHRLLENLQALILE